jgi:cellobiose transport system substrate-binding protein
MKLNPDITVKENVTTRTDVHWPKSLTRLQAGSGTDGVQAIEADNVTEAGKQIVSGVTQGTIKG